MSSIADRIELVRHAVSVAVRASGRDEHDVRLLAVSKKQPLARLQAAYDAGLRDFGENYVQGLEEHASHFGGLHSGEMNASGDSDAGPPSSAPASSMIRWHFIGHLQSNKAKRILGVSLMHSLDSKKLATVLAKSATHAGVSQACLINVNISDQDSKSGILPEKLGALLDELSTLQGIDIQGVMCIPSPDEDAQTAFARLRILRDTVQHNTDFRLRELSMGMSNSFEEAIAEGATIVRVGTKLFGPRL